MNRRISFSTMAAPLGVALAVVVAGSSGCGGGNSVASNSSGTGGASGGSGGVGVSLGGNGGTGADAGTPPPGPYKLPAGFTKTEFGGYKLGPAFNGDTPPTLDGGTTSSSNGCGTTILGVVRDFQGFDVGGHPDFEHYSGGGNPTPGLVQKDLGSDKKPVYTGLCEANPAASCPYGQQTTSKSYFDQWYRYAANVNKPYVVYLSLQPNGNLLTFQSDLFFPLDNAGFGNSGKGTDGKQHNFGFTTEVHTQFKYQGGETFSFSGDDDVWVFINGKLAVDLGGLHTKVTGKVNLDAQAGSLGLVKGKTYPLDLFHAERHTVESHFRIDTDLEFTNCGTIVPEPPPA